MLVTLMNCEKQYLVFTDRESGKPLATVEIVDSGNVKLRIDADSKVGIIKLTKEVKSETTIQKQASF